MENKPTQPKLKGSFKVKDIMSSLNTKLNSLNPGLITIFVVLCLFIFISFFRIDSSPQNHEQPIQEKENTYISANQAFESFYYTGVVPETQKNKQETEKFPAKFTIEKVVWFFKFQTQQMTQEHKAFEIMNMKNNEKFIQNDVYKITYLSQNNYTNFISQLSQDKIKKINEIIDFKYQYYSDDNIKKQIDQSRANITKRLIIYFLLLENGGIFIDNKLTLVESLSWLENVMTLPYINIGDKINSQIQPQCFGFFRQEYSSFRSNVNVKRQYQFEKKMHMFPSLEEEFLACTKGSEYLKRLIEAYLEILEQRDFSVRWVKLNKNESLIGKTNTKTIFAEGHLMANHAILQEHQRELDLTNKGPYRKLAIDDWGLVTMNSGLSLQKMIRYFPHWNSRLSFNYLSKMTIQMLEYHTGPIRFIWKIDEWVTELLIKQMRNIKPDDLSYIAENSFVDKFYLSHLLKQKENALEGIDYLIRPPTILIPFDIGQNMQNQQWKNIPKQVWVIWNSGIKNSDPIVEICAQNLKRSAENSGMNFHIITKDNVNNYLSKQIQEKIEYTIKHSNLGTPSPQMMSDIWRLALLTEHGGIYVDISSFSIEQSFDWIKNITRMPSHLVWNRFDKFPQVFMLYNTYYANPGHWKYDQQSNTNKEWHLAYESNYIAAVKNNEFIREWFGLFIWWITIPFQNIAEQMKSVNMYQDRWTNPGNRYLLVMDAVKFVNGRRQKILAQQNNTKYKNSAHYYKIWSMSGQMTGQLKFRSQSQLQNRDYRNREKEGGGEEIYRWEYPLTYVQSVNGPIIFQCKFFSRAGGFNEFLIGYYQKHRKGFTIQALKDVIHPQSLIGAKLVYKYPERMHNILSYYTRKSMMKVEFKSLNNFGF